jgi:hypothetical protein
MKTISINIIATNKYLSFVEGISKSISKFFFPDCRIIIIVHSNLDIRNSHSNTDERIRYVHNFIEHEPWPYTTLKRFHYFVKAKEIITESDYSFYIDADSLFVGEIDIHTLPSSGLFGTIHPCLNEGCGTPERNNLSTAYIPLGSNNRYFCGGFFGGSSREFIKMSEKLSQNIDKDLENGIIAIWHDESHINNYFFHNPPSYIFEPPFAVAENLTIQQESSKVKFLDKNLLGGHHFFRN